MATQSQSLPPSLAVTAWNLHLDAAAAEVIGAFRNAGIASILLKGPSLGRRLYAEGERLYVDCDLIVSPRDLLAAARVLQRLRFRNTISPEDVPDERSLGTENWVRASVQVELHRTILGVGVPAAALWDALRDHLVPLEIGRACVDVLSDPGLAFHAALHAAYHGEHVKKPLSDLERSLALFDYATWEQAARLAERVDAIPAFAAGLRLLPDGERVASGLSLPSARSIRVALYARSAPASARAVERLLGTAGPRARARLVRRTMFPSSRFMRAHFPLAERGQVGLLLAYVVRLGSRAAQLPRGLRIWFRTRGGG